jgi:hypothetical protein
MNNNFSTNTIIVLLVNQLTKLPDLCSKNNGSPVILDIYEIGSPLQLLLVLSECILLINYYSCQTSKHSIFHSMSQYSAFAFAIFNFLGKILKLFQILEISDSYSKSQRQKSQY